MQQFTPQSVQTISDEIRNALKEISKKHNINIKTGTVRWDRNEFSVKVTATIISEEAQQLLTQKPTPELLNAMMGKSYKVRNSIWTVTAVHPNEPKFNVSVKTNRGKGWKVPHTDILTAIPLN